MKNPIIQFENFTYKYRAQKEPTIIDINLTIYEGEKVLIVGPSGSGKSTLAHCINGLVPFSFKGDITGSLTIKGQSPSKLGIFEMSKIVGTVLQDSDGLLIGLTVAEDIAFALENDCVPKEIMEKQVLDNAKLVGAENLLSHSPHALSGGQKQRIALAGVMTLPIDILLFDEPLANLDPATGKYAIELIDDIHKQSNTTVLIIEHRLEDVLHQNVDRILIMDQGRIIADLSPDELLTTSILKEVGIREPLYINAIKYAGCEIHEKDLPANIRTMNLTPYKEKVQNWYDAISLPENQINEPEVLRIENLSFHYNQSSKEVLKNINFSIHKGEMLSIIGQNGAGKSTLTKLICGFEHPTKGDIYYEGKSILNDSIKKRAEKIGMVMQNPNQMISKSMIYDEVALGLIARGIPEDEIKTRVEETLKICGLYPFRNWPINALSFGQKKRVTIASILVLNPRILILDEPTAGQDFKHYTEIMEFLEEINKKHGITIIMVTHDMHLMLEYTRRAVVLSESRLIADKDTAWVLTDESTIVKASLKMTSLYDLAIKCDIKNPTAFVERFIEFDREVRK